MHMHTHNTCIFAHTHSVGELQKSLLNDMNIKERREEEEERRDERRRRHKNKETHTHTHANTHKRVGRKEFVLRMEGREGEEVCCVERVECICLYLYMCIIYMCVLYYIYKCVGYTHIDAYSHLIFTHNHRKEKRRRRRRGEREKEIRRECFLCSCIWEEPWRRGV